MPVAQPFRFYGARRSTPGERDELFSGFPHTIAVDVSNVDYWITLGGTQKGQTPTPEQIALSLKNAGKAFWLSYSLTASGNATLLTEPEPMSVVGEVTARAGEPSSRCVGWPSEMGYLGQRGELDSGSVSLVANFHPYDFAVARMFLGDLFLGWGIRGFARVSAGADGEMMFADTAVDERIYGSFGSEPEHPGWSDYEEDFVAEVVDLGGLPFFEFHRHGVQVTDDNLAEAAISRATLDFWDPPAN